MTNDELDRILASDDALEPSSGFSSSVMEAVRREAAAPASPPFPWARFGIGIAASGAMAAAGTLLLLDCQPTLATAFAPLATAAPELVYAAAALLLTLGLISIPRLLSRN